MLSVEKLKELGQQLPLEESALTEVWNQFATIGSDEDFELRFEVVRLLRNTATKTSSQTLLLSKVDTFIAMFCKIAATSADCNDLEKAAAYRRFLWQFLYNVSVGQESFQTLLWQYDVFKEVYFETLHHSDDSKLKNVLFGVAFLRLKRDDQVNSEKKILMRSEN